MGYNLLKTPQDFTWNIIMEVWKMIFLSKLVICRFQPLIFQGAPGKITSQKGKDGLPTVNFSGVNHEIDIQSPIYPQTLGW